jgi:hypothetical protein
MAILLRKTPQGILEARIESTTSFVLMDRSIRVVNGFEIRMIKYLHHYDPNRHSDVEIVYALSCVSMKMLTATRNCPQGMFGTDGRRGTSKPVYYPHLSFLTLRSLDTSPSAVLHDGKGNIYSGSNIYSDRGNQAGSLCLGERLDPAEWGPVDLLLYNEANRDLPWRGSILPGEWITHKTEEGKLRVFHIHQWHPAASIRILDTALYEDASRRLGHS